MNWDEIKGVAYALLPTVGLLVVFYVVIRSILRADASEREAAGQFGIAEAGDGEKGNPDDPRELTREPGVDPVAAPVDPAQREAGIDGKDAAGGT